MDAMTSVGYPWNKRLTNRLDLWLKLILNKWLNEFNGELPLKLSTKPGSGSVSAAPTIDGRKITTGKTSLKSFTKASEMFLVKTYVFGRLFDNLLKRAFKTFSLTVLAHLTRYCQSIYDG